MLATTQQQMLTTRLPGKYVAYLARKELLGVFDCVQERTHLCACTNFLIKVCTIV